MLNRLLVGLADLSRHHARIVVLTGALLAAFSAWFASGHLGVSTDTDLMFSASLPWRQRSMTFSKEFPQFRDLLVLVVDGRTPEEADTTAAALATAAAADHTHFNSVRRPDASPFFNKEGLLFLDPKQLQTLMDKTIDAQPFLGQLVADPSIRGLLSALALLGMGVTQGDVDLGPYLDQVRQFHESLAAALAGHPHPVSWQDLLGGGLSELGPRYRFVLVQPKLDFNSLQPGGEATDALQQIIAGLEFVKAGTAQVRITGQVALSDEEFSTVAKGAVEGLVGSVLLISLWLFLAVKTWRLILPILMTLGLGLMLTLLFAAAAVGTLNLVSVGFGVLFVGIAVDFAIQFSVRYRERRHEYPDDPEKAMRRTALRTGAQILVAAVATAAGFLAFVPTAFSGVAELGLIAGVGMLIAFFCTMAFLPAAIALFRPRGEEAFVGFAWAAPLDRDMVRWRYPILAAAAVLAVIAVAVSPHLRFVSDPLATKDPDTEAMRTLRMLLSDPLTNPYTIDILAPNDQAAEVLAAKLRPLATVSQVTDINSFVPDDQQQKLAIIADAATILGPTVTPPPQPPAPITPDQVRLAATTALAQIDPALAKLPRDHPLALIAEDLRDLRTAPDAVAMAANEALTRFLPNQLEHLRMALSAEPVT
ncbi:MAG: MMPL family transporter, partial [Acetobacteraceae bacterium]|nr:MMPL family transporter [Acetobacteraceae bacterium]